MVGKGGFEMQKNQDQSIAYTKSWLKLIFVLIASAALLLVCLAAINADDAPAKWFIWIVLFAVFIPIYIAGKSLLLPVYLHIDEAGINFSGLKLPWGKIDQIILDETFAPRVHYYTIYIIYGEQTAKPLMYYFNRKKGQPSITIHPYQLNAPTLDIFETLKRYHYKYGDNVKLTNEEREYLGVALKKH